MERPFRKCDGQPPRKKQMELDMFWKEFESIEPSVQETTEEEDEPVNELEQDVEWLKEAGFTSVVNRYRDSKEIDADDLADENIASSLTRKQADAVRRRINKLNANVKERLSLQDMFLAHDMRLSPPENSGSRQRYHHADIRSVFPTQTKGEPSNRGMPAPISRRSYSEGVPLAGSQPRKDPRMRTSRSQDNLNEISPTSPVKVITTSTNVQAQVIGRPTVSAQGNRTPSPKMKRESAAPAAQLIGKGPAVREETPKTTLGQSSYSGQRAGGSKARKLGGSLFYITAVNNPTAERSSPPEKMKDLSLNDNWQFSVRKNSPSSEGQMENFVSTPEEQFPHSDHNNSNRETFKEVPVSNDKPTIEVQKNEVNSETTPKFPLLPNFTLQRDEYGITRIEDLSPQDMEKVRTLALIELTALFDSNNLVFRRKKPTKRKTKESGIFGVPLLNIIQRDRGDNPKYYTPVILEEMIAFLENKGIKEEGILRVPGSAARVRTMREEIEEKFPEGMFSWNGRKPHDVAALLKQFLRELPYPLLTHEYQPTFALAEDIPDRLQQLQALNLLVLLLPQGHRDTLRRLLLFLCHVIAKQKENKMDLNNVAMIMAPNLFLNTGNQSRATLREVEMAKGTINTVRMLIKYHAILWTVPSFMIQQVRFLYEVEQAQKTKENKGKKRKAKRACSDQVSNDSPSIKKSPSVDELQDFENHIIRVKAPSLNKVGMAIQLTKTTNARDVVEKFCQASMTTKEASIQNSIRGFGPHSHKLNKCPCGNNHFLYEVGGNIGERCLDFETNLLQLSRLNRFAEWVVKIKE